MGGGSPRGSLLKQINFTRKTISTRQYNWIIAAIICVTVSCVLLIGAVASPPNPNAPTSEPQLCTSMETQALREKNQPPTAAAAPPNAF